MIHYQQPAVAKAAPKPGKPQPRDIVAEMAIAMREMAFTGTTVDATSLRQKGFTGDEIDTHWPAACDRANRDMIRQVA